MTQATDKHDLEAVSVTYGTVLADETAYFTGGLAGFAVQSGGLALTPVRGTGGVSGISGLSWPQLCQLAAQCGGHFVGSNQASRGNGAVPTEIWTPSVAPPIGQFNGADSWGTISHRAHIEGDVEYEEAARYLSVSMQAAGLRLRDVARAHHYQLLWALQDGRSSGASFSNIALFDLYVDFHSLATELCAARDHLAYIAAITLGAPKSINGLAWLEGWLKGPSKSSLTQEPIAALLLAALGTKESPSWLRRLGDLRNQMVHRQPMAANPEAAMLRLVEMNTIAGPITTIRLAPSIASGLSILDSPDPFVTILELYNLLEQLTRRASEVARYQPRPLTVRAN